MHILPISAMAAALAAAAAFAAVVPTAGAARPGAAAMVLARADLPHVSNGWRRDLASALDNEAVARSAGVPVAVVVAAGRITGYTAVFDQKLRLVGRSRVTIGCCIDQVGSFVDVFGSRGAAHARLGGAAHAGWRQLAVRSRIGDEMLVFSGALVVPYRGAGAQEQAYQVSWRSGRVLGTVLVGGLSPTLTDALRLARAQQARIADAFPAPSE
jgi:hypothetical protein